MQWVSHRDRLSLSMQFTERCDQYVHRSDRWTALKARWLTNRIAVEWMQGISYNYIIYFLICCTNLPAQNIFIVHYILCKLFYFIFALNRVKTLDLYCSTLFCWFSLLGERAQSLLKVNWVKTWKNEYPYPQTLCLILWTSSKSCFLLKEM